MNPGRELDAVVAEKVMGWKRMSYHQTQPTNKYYMDRHELTSYWYDKDGREVFLAEPSDCIDCGSDFPAWSPSARIDHAWMVVDKLAARQIEIEVRSAYDICRDQMIWRTKTFSLRQVQAVADTAPHAICLAALEVVGHPIQP
jgi:hypothetical protein